VHPREHESEQHKRYQNTTDRVLLQCIRPTKYVFKLLIQLSIEHGLILLVTHNNPGYLQPDEKPIF